MIEPIFDALWPMVIVEIGSDQGGNTEKLLAFCRQTGATLHVIDPAPRYDASEWQRKHEGYLVFHEDLSLNVLPRIEAFDAVLIDGDHNWYTVFNELKLIEDLCNERSREFPLIMLHDIDWPYGRRDLYYAPDTIPEKHRKPYESKGMMPGVTHLLEEGGLNQHLHNAVLENEPRSGVLTAVEDFLRETYHGPELIKLPGIHGLGILLPPRLKENAKIASFLSDLHFSPSVSRYLEALEKDRRDAHIRQQVESRKLRETRQELGELPKLARWLEEMSEGTSSLLRSRQWRIGYALSKFWREILRRPKEPKVSDHLEEIIVQFRAWQRGHTSRIDGPSSDSDFGREEPTKPGTGERP